MDFQPPNAHVRGALAYGFAVKLPDAVMAYRYLDQAQPEHRVVVEALSEGVPHKAGPERPQGAQAAEETGLFGTGRDEVEAGKHWTSFGDYTAVEAHAALALPGREPTHVLGVELPAGTMVLRTAWVEPLPAAMAFADVERPRPGNGTEFVTLDAVSLRTCKAVVRRCRT